MKLSFPYNIVYSNRKTVAIQVTAENKVIVRAPHNCPRSFIDAFLSQKAGWVEKHLKENEQKKASHPEPDRTPRLTESRRKRYMEKARTIFSYKTAHYARILGVTYNRIAIREQKTRWGSCSSKGNLNFNWRLIFAPEEVIDYIVVHELAHRKEMNHSQAFYDVVASVMPDYKTQEQWLKEHGDSLWSHV